MEIIASIVPGFVPMLGSMELAWRMKLHKKSDADNLSGEINLVDVNRSHWYAFVSRGCSPAKLAHLKSSFTVNVSVD
jgi:hypothetical protein